MRRGRYVQHGRENSALQTTFVLGGSKATSGKIHGVNLVTKIQKWCKNYKKWPHQQRGALRAPLLPAIFCSFCIIFGFSLQRLTPWIRIGQTSIETTIFNRKSYLPRVTPKLTQNAAKRPHQQNRGRRASRGANPLFLLAFLLHFVLICLTLDWSNSFG